jgi:ElaB/YqjD/DUF883 family membrane-anchored ribosome-binding protein
MGFLSTPSIVGYSYTGKPLFAGEDNANVITNIAGNGKVTTLNGVTFNNRDDYNLVSDTTNSDLSNTIDTAQSNAALLQSVANSNLSASVATLAGADLAANETSDAITAAQNYVADPTLGGDAAPAPAGSSSSIKYLLYVGLAYFAFWLWKKYRKKI